MRRSYSIRSRSGRDFVNFGRNCPRFGLGLGRVGRLGRHAGRLDRQRYGLLLHRGGDLQREDGDRGFDQRGYDDPLERVSPRGQPGSDAPIHRQARGQSAKNKALYNERIKNLQENPTARDIETGDALNAALNQLIDPRISSSALRIATAPIEASVIREIPFRNASEAVTIVLSQVKAVTKWPAALEGERVRRGKEGVRRNRREGAGRRRSRRHLASDAQEGP